MRPNGEGRPPGRHTGESGQTSADATYITTASVTAGGLPVAFASQAEPCAGRTLWALMYRCGACGGTHFGRAREEVATGKRTARCGRVVWLVISRTYRASAP